MSSLLDKEPLQALPVLVDLLADGPALILLQDLALYILSLADDDRNDERSREPVPDSSPDAALAAVATTWSSYTRLHVWMWRALATVLRASHTSAQLRSDLIQFLHSPLLLRALPSPFGRFPVIGAMAADAGVVHPTLDEYVAVVIGAGSVPVASWLMQPVSIEADVTSRVRVATVCWLRLRLWAQGHLPDTVITDTVRVLAGPEADPRVTLLVWPALAAAVAQVSHGGVSRATSADSTRWIKWLLALFEWIPTARHPLLPLVVLAVVAIAAGGSPPAVALAWVPPPLPPPTSRGTDPQVAEWAWAWHLPVLQSLGAHLPALVWPCDAMTRDLIATRVRELVATDTAADVADVLRRLNAMMAVMT